MPDRKWIKNEENPSVVLATLADSYLADLADSEMEGEDLTQMSRRHLSEAIEEFYALHPYLGQHRKVRAAS